MKVYNSNNIVYFEINNLDYVAINNNFLKQLINIGYNLYTYKAYYSLFNLKEPINKIAIYKNKSYNGIVAKNNFVGSLEECYNKLDLVLDNVTNRVVKSGFVKNKVISKDDFSFNQYGTLTLNGYYPQISSIIGNNKVKNFNGNYFWGNKLFVGTINTNV